MTTTPAHLLHTLTLLAYGLHIGGGAAGGTAAVARTGGTAGAAVLGDK